MSDPSDNESYRTNRTGQTSRTIRTSWQVLHLISPYTLVPFADLSDKVLAESANVLIWRGHDAVAGGLFGSSPPGAVGRA